MNVNHISAQLKEYKRPNHWNYGSVGLHLWATAREKEEFWRKQIIFITVEIIEKRKLPSNFHCWVFSLNSTKGEKLDGTSTKKDVQFRNITQQHNPPSSMAVMQTVESDSQWEHFKHLPSNSTSPRTEQDNNPFIYKLSDEISGTVTVWWLSMGSCWNKFEIYSNHQHYGEHHVSILQRPLQSTLFLLLKLSKSERQNKLV